MTNVDVFGKSMKKSVSVFKILSNAGLNLINDFLSVKLDPNINNILSSSANGLMVNAIKSTGGVMTGILSMKDNKIIDLDEKINSTDGATKNYVDNKKVKIVSNLYRIYMAIHLSKGLQCQQTVN